MEAENLYESHHPLVKHLVTRLRDDASGPGAFRQVVRQIAGLLAYEALSGEATVPTEVSTWKGTGRFPALEEEGYVFIPVLRAALPMLDGILDLLPGASAGFLAMKRDETTFQPTLYYDRVPPLEGKTAVLLDPMVATGGSLADAIHVVKAKHPARILSLNIIGAPEGLAEVTAAHPEVTVHIAQVDPGLENGFIVPGLGDAGDRAFNTP